MADANDVGTSKDWRPGAIWLALIVSTAVLLLRLFLDSSPAQAAATALLSGVIVFGLALVANERGALLSSKGQASGDT